MKTCEITIYLKQETEGNPLGCVILKDVSKYRLTHDSIYEFYTPSYNTHVQNLMAYRIHKWNHELVYILKRLLKYRLTHDSIYEFYTPSDSEHEYCMMEIPRENVNYIRRLEY